MKYQIKSCGLSDIGLVRDNNEDVWKALPEYNLFVLADGMGGHRAGEVAAEEAVTVLCKLVKEMNVSNFTPEEAHGMLQLAIERTNMLVYQKSLTDRSLYGMGTTLCCLYFHEKGLIYGHVGDSRIYRHRNQKLEPLTRDHSLLREMIDKGHLTQQEGDESGFKNVITRAIGTEPYIEPAVHMDEIVDGDLYIMCSDGLTDMITQDEIEAITNQYNTIEMITEALVEEAKAKGGRDNITVVTVQVNEK